MQKKKMVYGLPQIKVAMKLCEEYYVAKQTRNSFNNALPMKSKQKLEIVHSNVCGPYEVNSLGGNCYFLTFIYEFTRKVMHKTTH